MDVKREEKLEQMERIVQSQALHGSEHLRAFLRYVVQKAADNQDSQLKEYVIATEVLGRGSDFDPRTESVVRVQAGRLRSKLLEYYASAGKHDKVLIDLPKGHYIPAFSYLQHENGSANHHSGNGSTVANASVETSIVPPAPAPQPQSTKRTPWQLGVVVLAGLSLTLGLLTLRYRSEGKQLRKALAVQTADSPDVRLLNALWSEFFSSPEPILVAYSNTIFQGRAETGMKILKPYDSPASSFESPLSSLPHRAEAADSRGGAVISDHYTGVGEVMSIYHLGNLFFKVNHPYRVKRSLLLSWDDLKTQNIVMLGSPAENLLLRGLPQEQSFVFKILKDAHQKPRYGIANLNPQPGEQTTYMSKEEGPSTSQLVEDYALVSLLKGLDEKNNLLILAGMTTFGTQAATEYVTKPEYFKELIARLNTSPDAHSPKFPDYYQILLKVKVQGGVPIQISYVTHHVLK